MTDHTDHPSKSVMRRDELQRKHTYNELLETYDALLDEFWDMRELHPDQFKGALLSRLREFSKPVDEAMNDG